MGKSVDMLMDLIGEIVIAEVELWIAEIICYVVPVGLLFSA